jgi:hypothetical protein
VLPENGWTSTQSCGVGVGEGDGDGDGVGVGDGLLLGDGLGVAAGLWPAGEVALGSGLADGVGLVASLTLGDGLALGLALAAWLGVAEAELPGTLARPNASARVADCPFFDLPVVTAGRWAHVLVVLSRLAREACGLAREACRLAREACRLARGVCAAAVPPAPLPTRSNPAMTLKVAVWVRPIAIVIETPSPRCRPQRGRRTALPYLIAVRMSRLTYSLLTPFDTSCRGRGHSPRGKLYHPKTVQ